MRQQLKRARWLALLPILVFAGACNLLPDAYSGCDQAQHYQSALDLPPLRVPDGAVVPDTRNAMRIPTLSAPVLPAGEKRCLDHPPSYSVKPAAG